MNYEGYSAVLDIIGGLSEVYPAITDKGVDARFVTIEPHKNDGALDVNLALNALTEAGFMEQHGACEAIYRSTPLFRVVAISGTVIHLEDTKSRLY